jgi:short subunit dehydrogenase-like uncharacterized protein
MIYGATGYTGRMAAEHALAAGLNVILGGRDDARLAKLATELDAEYRTFGLEDSAAVEKATAQVAVLLNCAGPFMRTTEPLMSAAIRSGTRDESLNESASPYASQAPCPGGRRSARRRI